MRPSVKKLLLFGTTAPYAGAMLALDFVGSRSAGTPYYMLNGVRYPTVTAVPGWTYTGGTPAGTGSYAPKADGSLQFFPSVTNLLLQSQKLNTTWAKNGTPTVTENYSTAPDGTTTSNRIVPAGSTQGVLQAISVTSGNTYTLSVYVKDNGGASKLARIGVSTNAFATGSGDRLFTIDTSTGATSSVDAVLSTPVVTSVGNGWFRVSTSYTATATTAVAYQIVYASLATADFLAWGAQLELGSTASTYIPTTTAAVTVAPPRITDAGYLAEEARTNLLTYSQQFDNAAWVKGNGTVSANSVTSPDGTTTADTFTGDGSAGTAKSIAQTLTPTAAAHTTSIYAKAGTNSYVQIRFSAAIGGGAYANFDLSAGTVGTSTVTSASITPIGNGWYRCTATQTLSAASGSVGYFLVTSSSAGSSETNSLSTSIYIWQADLQAGSFATSPIPTTSVAVTRAADVGYINAFSAPTDGTMFVEGSVAAGTTGNSPILLGHNSANTAGIFVSSTNGNHWNGTATAGNTGTVSAFPAITRMALAYTGTASRSLSVNGSAVTTSATTVGTINRIAVGTPANGVTPAQSAQAPIRRIVIYPRAMSNAELQAITTAGAY